MRMKEMNKHRMPDVRIVIRLPENTAKKLERTARIREESISDFAERAIQTKLARLGSLNQRETRSIRPYCLNWELIRASDGDRLGARIIELLRISPNSESTIELQLLKDRTIRVRELN